MNQQTSLPHCTFCGSTKISPETRLASETFFAQFIGVQGIIFQGPNISIARVRLCGDCGYVMLFTGEKSLEKLQDNWDKLKSR